jgi:hypothetical protein
MLTAVLNFGLYDRRLITIHRNPGSLFLRIANVVDDLLFLIVNFENAFKALIVPGQKKLHKGLYHVTLLKWFL